MAPLKYNRINYLFMVQPSVTHLACSVLVSATQSLTRDWMDQYVCVFNVAKHVVYLRVNNIIRVKQNDFAHLFKNVAQSAQFSIFLLIGYASSLVAAIHHPLSVL